MATIFSHALAATALGRIYTAEEMPFRFWVLSALCAMLPDADVVGFVFRIRYGDLWGHRGLSHSLLFAFLVGCVVVCVAFWDVLLWSKRWWSMLFYFSSVTASHGLLDALTNGGLGVAFFAPFDSTRYFFPWRPVEVSPIGLGFFSDYGVRVMLSEIIWIWIPSILLVLVVWSYRTLRGRSAD